MPKFQDYLFSIKDGKQHQQIRIQLMMEIEEETKRKLIVYAADFKKSAPGTPNTIEPDDKTGFADLIEGLEGEPLDILIRSPGGSAEAVEQLVSMLRANFDDIRFIVPDMAMSAATLMCLSGNWILMDEQSFLGPIDPQIEIVSSLGRMRFPAQTVIDGFKQAKEAIAGDERALPVFLPWLNQFGPFVQVCQNAIDLSRELATKWAETYMLAGQTNAEERARRIAAYLSDHGVHKSHGRPIGIKDAVDHDLQVIDLRKQPSLRELVRKLWAAIDLYFDRSASVKMFENAHGVHWSRNVMVQEIKIPIPSPFQPPATPPQTKQPPYEGRPSQPRRRRKKR